MINTSTQHIEPDSGTGNGDRLSLNERLALISLIDEGMRGGSADTPMISDLFSNLWDLVSETISGSKIDRLKPEETRDGFSVFEINAETGENLGRLHMLYLKKPIPCYYLVYVEVAPPFRRKGLGNRILEHFREFLKEKSAVGILDNIIPEEDLTYDIYSKQSWEPIEAFIGNGTGPDENYMVWIPPKLYGKSLRKPLLKLLVHLRRKRESIDMRENEVMVRRTITEFKELYSALCAYFGDDPARAGASPLARFMFTRFTTKLIAFRRRIGELIGYTGGESMEQIVLTPEIAALPVQSYAPYDMSEGGYTMTGDEALCSRIRKIMKKHPSRFIESLPVYGRPSFISWMKSRKVREDHKLTIGDLMDLGFDPTRLKEITIDGIDYIFERIQARQLPKIERLKELLSALEPEIAGRTVHNARLMVNPPLLTIRDRGNAYILRRKVDGIHLDEALEQIQVSPALKGLNESLNLNRLFIRTVAEAVDLVSEKKGLSLESVHDLVTFFVSWNLTKNHPGIMVDFAATCLQTVWLA